jgi:hypothetical protein
MTDKEERKSSMKLIKKTMMMMVLMIAVGLIFANVALAQLYVVDDPIWTLKKFTASTADSTNMIFPIVYNGNSIPILKGAYPDSIRFNWFETGDTVYYITPTLKLKYATSTGNGRLTLDAITSATSLAKYGGTTLNARDFSGADYLGFVATAGTTNAGATANASKLTAKVSRYFKK